MARSEWHGKLNSQQDIVDLIVNQYRQERLPGGRFEQLQGDVESLFTMIAKETISLYGARKIVELLGWDLGKEAIWSIALVIMSKSMQRREQLITR